MKRFDISTILLVFVVTIFLFTGCDEVQKPSLDANTLLERGNAFANKGKYDQAISSLEQASEFMRNTGNYNSEMQIRNYLREVQHLKANRK